VVVGARVTSKPSVPTQRDYLLIAAIVGTLMLVGAALYVLMPH